VTLRDTFFRLNLQGVVKETWGRKVERLGQMKAHVLLVRSVIGVPSLRGGCAP
jgi:hypothetical protein